jgi:phage terminase large subunit-like protein
MSVATDNLTDIIRLLPGYDPYAHSDGWVFDPDRAARAIGWIEGHCRFIQGPKTGEPFLLEPWEKAIVANLYGWWTPDGKERRYRQVLLMTGRGNGKSVFAAAILLVELYAMRHDAGGDFYSIAGKQDQTRFVFDPVVKMIEAASELKREAITYKRSVLVQDRSYRAIPHSAGTEIGGAVQVAVADEAWVYPDRSVLDMLETGMIKRRNPLLLVVSTSDWEREASPCNQLHDYACKVRDGAVPDARFLPAIYEVPKERETEWTDSAVWPLANPNLDVTIRLSDLRDIFERAKNDPALEAEVKRLHLNICTQAMTAWLPIERWDACHDPSLRLEDFRGEPCWGAFDIASSDDLNALALVFRIEDGAAVFFRFWCPRQTAAKREREKRLPYSVWEAEGWITLTDGNVTDIKQIHEDTIALIDQYSLRLQEIPVDRAFQGLDLIRRFVVDDGFEAFAHGQGSLGMIPPTKVTKDLILARKLRHDGNPVMRWMMGNVVVHPGEGCEYPMKRKSPDKIDGPVSMVMGVGRAMTAEVIGESWYEDHDLEFV